MPIRRWRHWTHSSGDIKTIKIGWSWPACLFTVPWLIYKRMWQALIWLVPTGLLALIAVATFEVESLGLDTIDFVIYPVIMVSILFGLIGNKLYEDKLRKQFYQASKIYTSAATRRQKDNALAVEKQNASSDASKDRHPPLIVYSANSENSRIKRARPGPSQHADADKPDNVKARINYLSDRYIDKEIVPLARSARRPAHRAKRGSRRRKRIARPVKHLLRPALSGVSKIKHTIGGSVQSTDDKELFNSALSDKGLIRKKLANMAGLNPTAGFAAAVLTLLFFVGMSVVILSPPTPQIVAFHPAGTAVADSDSSERGTMPRETGSEHAPAVTQAAISLESISQQNYAELIVDIDGLFDTATDTLATIVDKSTAIDALPQLNYLNGKAEDLRILCANLPSATRTKLRDLVDSSMTDLRTSASRVTVHTEAEKIIGTTIAALTSNLENFDSLEPLAFARDR